MNNQRFRILSESVQKQIEQGILRDVKMLTPQNLL